MGKLDNKVAIITGGNAGVGKEIAKLFVKEQKLLFQQDVNKS